MAKVGSAEQAVREIRRRTLGQFSAEEKIWIVLKGLRGEERIAALCRREGLAQRLAPTTSPDAHGSVDADISRDRCFDSLDSHQPVPS